VDSVGGWLIVIGGLVGAVAGGVYEWRAWRRRHPAAAPTVDQAEPVGDPAERRREVTPLVERVGRAMAAYSDMIDAGNAQDLNVLRRIFERLRADEAEDGPPELRAGDRRLLAAMAAFEALHGEIAAKLQQRIDADQPAAAAGEIRLRGPQLASVVDELNAAAERYVSAVGR
jgi:hypothetical protein